MREVASLGQGNNHSRKMNRRIKLAMLAASAAAALPMLLPGNQSAQAADLWWDINGTTVGGAGSGTAAAGAAGTWNATNTNWSTVAAGNVATSTWSGQSGTTARFAAGTNVSNAYTVTVGDAESVSALVFEEGTVTLSGASGSLNIPSVGNTFIITSLKNNDNNITVPIIGTGDMLITGHANGDGTGSQPANICKVDITGDLTNFTGAVTIDAGNSLAQTCILQLDSPLGNTSNPITIRQFGALGTTNLTTGMNLTIANPIVINTDSSIFNSNTGVSGTQRITNFTGSISGSGNLYVGFMNGGQSGGRGTVVLGNSSTAQYTYNGDTYDLLASNNGLMQIGKDNILPGNTSSLIFGASTAGSTGFAPVDLNGHSVTVKSLVTNTTGQALIMNTAVDATPAAVTLTIDGGASTASSTFAGVIGSTNTAINPFNNNAPYFVGGVSHVTAGTNISVIKTGSNTQVLTGVNTYTGDTTVNGGTLTLGKRFGTQSTPGTVTNTLAGNVIVNSGATLSTVAGTSASNTYFSAAGGSVTSSGAISPGTDGSIGGLYAPSLTLNTGSALKFDLPSATGDYDSIKLSGGLTLDSGTHSVALNSAPGAGTYTLLSYASRTWDGVNGFTLPTDPHWTWNFSDTALTLQVTDPNTHILVWDVGGGGTPVTDGDGTWVSDPSGTDPNSHNWLDIGPNAQATYDNANPYDIVIGNDVSHAGGTITMGGNITVGGKLTFGPISSPYTITDGGNNYTLTVNAARGVEADSNATISAAVSVSGDSHWNVVAGKTLTLTKTIQAGAFDTLFKDGTGALVVNGSGGTVGAITINGGTFESNDANLLGSAVFNIAQSTTLKITTPVTVAGDVTALDRTTTGQNFTWDFGANNVTFSGAIALKGNVTKKGTGDWTISGNNANFSGGTGVGILVINDSSTLHLASATPLGVSPSWMNLAFNNPSTLDVQTDAVIGAIRDGSQITKTGAGKLTVSGTSSATVGSSPSIDVQQGNLQIDNAAALGGGNSNTFGQMAMTFENGTEGIVNFSGTRNSLGITMNGTSTFSLASTATTGTDSELVGYNTNGTTFTNYGSVFLVNGNATLRNLVQSAITLDTNSNQVVVSHDFQMSMALHVTAGNTLTLSAANTAGDYGKAAMVLRGTDNAGGHPGDMLFIDGGATVDSSASVGEVQYGATGRGKPIVGVGPGTALLKLGLHAFMRDLGSSSDTNNGTVMTRLAVLNGVDLRFEAPMNATYTVPNPSGAPLLRTYDGTTGLLGTNTTDTFGSAPTGYTNIQNGYTVLSANRAHALSNTFNPNGFSPTAPSGTLTLAATDANDVTGVINVGPNATCAVGVALDNTASSANANLTYQIDGSADSGKFANFAALTIKKTNAGSGSVKAQLLSTTKIPQVSINNGTKLDVQDQKLILTATPVGTWNGSAYSDATGLIAAGYSPNQDFSGSGIVTSQSNATGGNTLTNIGIVSNADLGLATFGGQSVGANDTLIGYTYGGDANLDGAITGDDYFQIDSGFPAGAHGWFNGDFNYDGSITGDDYFIIDSNFAAQGPPFPPSAGAGAVKGVQAVPEPASIGIIAGGSALLLSRRRQRRPL